MRSAIAIAAHPDDIEMMMAGTLLMLQKAGYDVHYMNLSAGNCGSVEYAEADIKNIRLTEAKNAAQILGTHFHPPCCNDLEILYDVKTLRKIASVIREVKPNIVLTHSPEDYMEDHINTGRLAVTASFSRGMRNFLTDPERQFENFDCTIYHSLPHTLRDIFRRRIIPGSFVNTGHVHETKIEALKAHHSQQNWLDLSQKMNSYLQAMEDISLEVGKMSKAFTHAEGWRRHSHVGFSESGADPLKELGPDYLVNETYEKSLEW